MSDQRDPNSFREYVLQHRFTHNNDLAHVKSLMEDARRAQRGSVTVVLHPPFPQSRNSEERVLAEFQDIHSKANATGYGCGKTDFLITLERFAKTQGNYNVISCLENQERLSEGISFYSELLVAELVKGRLNRTLRLKMVVSSVSQQIRTRANQLALLINTAAIPFAALIAYVMTWLGFDAFEYIANPQNQDVLTSLALWVSENQIALLSGAVVGLLIWVFYAWGALQKDQQAFSRWCELNEDLRNGYSEQEFRNELIRDPAAILDRLATRSRPLLLLIDDLDVIDSQSIGQLQRLVRVAKESDKYSLFTVVGYNPWNPTLYCSDRRMIRRDLEIEHMREIGWHSVELAIPTLTDLRTWLWGYYQDRSAVDSLHILEREYAEARENPSLTLAFFMRYDAEKASDTSGIGSNNSFATEALFQQFDRFLRRDRREVRAVLQSIEQHDGGQGAIEMLKYVLAFKKLEVRADYVKALLGNLTEFKDFGSYEKVLLSDETNLLRKETRGGSYDVYVFRQPYMRAVLNTSWRQWRENATPYFNAVFVEIPRMFRSAREDPELALMAAPSLRAIDVLCREGDRLYRYAGESDAGTALRYLGLTRGGALGKWLQLFHEALENRDDLWQLVRWKSETRLNEKEGWSRESRDPFFFAPALFVSAANLYWMTGEWQTACEILRQRWRGFLASLQRLQTSEARLIDQVNMANAEIEAKLAEILYEVGNSQHWQEATTICSKLTGTDFKACEDQLGPALTLGLIKFHQKVGVGNVLPPFQFLRAADVDRDGTIDILKSAAASLSETNVNVLRALHVISDALWQMLWDPSTPIRVELSFLETKPLTLDESVWQQFKENHLEQLTFLKQLWTYRASQRHQRLPSGRIHDGDLLFWEALMWLASANYFHHYATEKFSKWPFLQKESSSKMSERVRGYYAIANELNDFCTNSVPDRVQLSNFTKQMLSVDSLFDRWPADDRNKEQTGPSSVSDLGRMFAEEKRRNLSELQGQLRRSVEHLYHVGVSEMFYIASSRLKFAETLYRRIGYEQGVASTRFERALISRQQEAYVRVSTDVLDRPTWVDELDAFLEANGDESGYSLESLRSHLLIGSWAKQRDHYLGVQSYQAANVWLLPERLDLPRPFVGEVNYRIGRIVGNMEASPFEDDLVFDALETTLSSFQGIDKSVPFVRYDEIIKRRIDIHWWFAELFRRQALRLPNTSDESKELLKRARSEAEKVISMSKGRSDYQVAEHQARLVRGSILAEQVNSDEGLDEVKRATAFFNSQGDDLYELQALAVLLRIVLRRYSVAPQRRKHYVEQFNEQYLERIAILSQTFLDRQSELIGLELAMLHRATESLGTYFTVLNQAVLALEWFNYTFDILTQLKLFGSAILLDRRMKPLFESGYTAGLAAHRNRIVQAAQHIDSKRERVSWDSIRRILNQYTSSTFANSQHVETKRQLLAQAKRALESRDPEIEPALGLLQQARTLVDRTNPEDIDIDVLATLQTALYRNDDALGARSAESELREVMSIVQSRDFLQLADYFRSIGGDYLWALQVASAAPVANPYSRRAMEELSMEEIPEPEDQDQEMAQDETDASTKERARLMAMPTSEFVDRDCRELLNIFERDMRGLIVDVLSRLTSKWWKQRIPADVRRNAETRKSERERQLPGRTSNQRPIWEYLDFADYEKIICMTANWNDAFQVLFNSQEIMRVKLGEIRTRRNDISHHRSLSPTDRDIFVVNARSLLQVIDDQNTPVL